MKKRSEPADWEALREQVIGFGQQSHKKSHYALSRERLHELERFRHLLDASDEIILVADANTGRIVDANGGACRRLGMERDELLGRALEEVCERSGAELSLLLAPNAGGGRNLLLRIRGRDGRSFQSEGSATLETVDGASFISLVMRDVTEQKRAEEAIHNLAFFDPLTGLPNRRLLLDRLQHSMAASTRNASYQALLFLDLDHFKTLNDTQGHHQGDCLLVGTARRLQACVREGDTVSRLGGDEFVLLLEQLSTVAEEAATQTEAIGEKVVARLAEPYVLGTETYRGTASIGITLFVGEEVAVDELLKRADLAMYQAKASGRNALRFFDPAMQAAVTARAALENDLRCAVAANEFVLYYQPQVDPAGICIGVEALLRWNSPVRGFTAPTEFIRLAEETGLIQPIGLWVMRQACAQLAQWQGDPHTARLSVAVNVSARQFKLPGFVGEVGALIDAWGINPERLKLEITESILVEDVDDVIAKMATLKNFGLSFSLDDFGTGYCSLAYVKRLPLDQIKIDQSFVRDVLVDPNDAAICRAVIGLGRSLGLATIAEGVETAAQGEFLRAEGCGAAQGYLYARPMPSGELLDWLGHRGATATPRPCVVHAGKSD